MVEVSNVDLCHDQHKVEDLGQMQKMWSAIIVIRKGTIENFTC